MLSHTNENITEQSKKEKRLSTKELHPPCFKPFSYRLCLFIGYRITDSIFCLFFILGVDRHANDIAEPGSGTAAGRRRDLAA